MDELLQILFEQAQKYPFMQPCDAVKLIYQNEFGGGHLVKNEEESLLRLKAEYDGSDIHEENPLTEKIGNGFHRLYLNALDSQKLPMECLNKLFIRSSAKQTGNMDSFLTKISYLQQAAKDGCFPFSVQDLDSFLTHYKTDGYPVLSHSDIYKEAYKPAYRVLHQDYVSLLPIIFQINLLQRLKPHITIALEGNAAAGKSTIANRLAEIYPANIIHMDDFFLPPDLRTPERYQEPGGNIHYERFQEEVLNHLNSSSSFSYRVFDCHSCSYSGVHEISPKPLTVIEGVYCMNPRFRPDYDLTVFIQTSPEEQARRIIARNGMEVYQIFKQKWIPLENHYFNECHVKERCHLVLST